ncbi:SGNH/GDSL hydrolase family protein [Mucilaginibacter puniceus]
MPDPSISHKVLILGNSITYAPANPSEGWNCACGMAASTVEKDFVHLLTARLKALNINTTVDAVNIAQFEREFDTYDFNKLQAYRDAKPDIIILRIGENVLRENEAALFEAKYVELLSYLKVNNTGVKILAAGSVWPNHNLANTVMSRHSIYISLLSLQNDLSNFALGMYTNPGIADHPSDKGMRSISDQIWAEMEKSKFL